MGISQIKALVKFQKTCLLTFVFLLNVVIPPAHYLFEDHHHHSHVHQYSCQTIDKQSDVTHVNIQKEKLEDTCLLCWTFSQKSEQKFIFSKTFQIKQLSQLQRDHGFFSLRFMRKALDQAPKNSPPLIANLVYYPEQYV